MGLVNRSRQRFDAAKGIRDVDEESRGFVLSDTSVGRLRLDRSTDIVSAYI